MDDKHVVTLWLQAGEIEGLTTAAAKYKPLTRNRVMRVALHLGMQALGKLTMEQTLKAFAELDETPVKKRFTGKGK